MATIDESLRRVPPQSLEAEEAVLGGILLDNAALDRVTELVQADDFYREAHRKVFRAMLDLSARNEPADLITLAEVLKARSELADVGGSAYLAELAERVPTAAHVAQYARIVRDKSILRGLIGAATQIAMHGYEGGGDVAELLDHAEQLIFGISDRKVKPEFVRISDLLVESLKTIERLYEQKQAVTGVPSGFHDLDNLTAGFQPSDLVIVAGRPSMGKCLAADAEIVLSDGSVRTVEEIVRSRAGRLLTLTDRWKFALATPAVFVDDGVKPVFEVMTRLGRRVRTTVTHPFLTITGWRPLAEIRPGDRVAVPGTSARQLAAELDVAPASITHWCQGRTVPGRAVFDGLCAALDLRPQDIVPAGPSSIRKSARNGLTRWLTSLGLWGKTAREKFVPDLVFTLVADEVACFLNRLFATDGWATVLASRQAQLGFCSTSERLARQVQHLLLRFGVIASLRERRVRYRAGVRLAFQLDITDAESIRTFIERIGIYGKEAALERVQAALRAKRYQTNRDLIPVDVWPQIDAARQGGSWRSVAARMGLGDTSHLHVGKRALSRRRLQAIARALGDQRLQAIATSDVYWDEVVSIEPMGERQVYDLTIPETHNFVANDVCVHNTALCLNIAEHAALRADVGVAIFSLEMSKEQLALRMLCSESRVDLKRVRTGHLSEREFPKLAMAAGRLADAPIFIDDTPALSILELRAKARRLKRDPATKLGLVIVDYLQLMRSTEGKDSREQEISEISRSLKALAKELNVPVIALSQLNRQVESRNPPKPRLADLRESGAIEQDADVIAFIYREEVYVVDTDKKGLAEIIVVMQRNGLVASVELTFLPEFTCFDNRELAPEEGAA